MVFIYSSYLAMAIRLSWSPLCLFVLCRMICILSVSQHFTYPSSLDSVPRCFLRVVFMYILLVQSTLCHCQISCSSRVTSYRQPGFGENRVVVSISFLRYL